MSKRFTDGAGFFFNDDRCSGGKLEEDDLLACSHCHKPLKKTEWKSRGGFCTSCFKPLCIECLSKIDQTGCVPEVERIQRAVDEDYRKRQNARVMGI